MNLNPEQQAAVDSDAQISVVVAGPGSGKSRVIIERIMRLLVMAGDAVDAARRLVVITYTNAAAHVIVERLKAEGVPPLGYVGTLHGFCMRLIQAHGGLIGYRAGSVSIVPEDVKEELLKETAKRFGSKISMKKLLDYPAPYSALPVAGTDPEARLVWNEYRHTLKRSNMVDYDQILFAGHELIIKVRPEVAELLVEEAQDSAPIDWDCYDMVPGRKFIVGDPDQCIFAFRGADPGCLVNMVDTGEVGDKTFTLSTNYRSDVAICEAANKLISHNKNRVEKLTVPMAGAMGGSFGTLECPDAGLELMAVFAGIRKQMENFGTPPNEIAVLARTNALADNMRNCLRGLCVPVKFTGSVQLPEDWRFALSCISLLVDPANDYHAERILKDRGDHQLEINAAKLKALRDGVPLAKYTLGKFVDGTRSNYLPDVQLSLALMGVTDESLGIISQRIQLLPNENPTLSDLLSDLWNHEKWNPQDASDGVTVSTIHGAKGKEWDAVYVIGCEEGLFPSLRVDDDIEEHRRLMFVAITRARHSLVCSWARTRTNYGKTTTQIPSRFLEEMR